MTDKRIEEISSLIRSHPGDTYLMAQLARSKNLSVSRLRHLFRKELGSSFKKHLNSIRLARARDLLQTSFMSVKQVMYEVGFRDETYFIRVFKREFGMTPGALKSGSRYQKSS